MAEDEHELKPEIGRKIRLLREALGESQREFGARFNPPVRQNTVSRWEAGRIVQRRHQMAIAMLAGMTVSEFFHGNNVPRLVPVLGRTEGEAFTPSKAKPGSSVEHIKPEIGGEGQVSVIVGDDTMVPVYQAGDTLIGTALRGEELAKAMRKDCIVETTDGRGFVRIVKPGSRDGLFTLVGHNPRSDDIVDVRLAYAAPVKIVVKA